VQSRKTRLEWVKKVCNVVTVPFAVGGGIGSLEDMKALIDLGVDKVSINTKAIKDPEFIKEAARKFGSQCIVVAIDARRNGEKWEVYINGGRDATGLDAVEWAKKAAFLGAGEILLTSMDRDGTKDGYDTEITKKIADAITIPIIASGGCGKLEDFYKALTEGGADAALAASVFHFKEFSVREVKEYLRSKGVTVRI